MIGTTTRRHARRPLRSALAGAACAAALLLPLASCAAEPDDTGAGATRTEGASDAKGGEGGSWTQQDDGAASEKHVELPESFPEAFAVPEGAVVDDTGARSGTEWFLVLRAADAAAADALWEDVIAEGGFTVSDEDETAEGGRIASLRNAALSVEALTLPQEDGSVLLSYDLSEG